MYILHVRCLFHKHNAKQNMFFRKPRYEKTAVIFIPMLFFTNHKTKTLKKGYARSTYYVVQVHAYAYLNLKVFHLCAKLT